MSRLSDFLDWLRGRIKPPKPPVPPVKPPPPKPDPIPVPGGNASTALLEAHNTARKGYGLPVYSGNAILNSVAQRQSDFQAQRDEIGHDGPGGSNPWERIKAAGYRYEEASENVAAGYGALQTAKEATEAWLESTVGHRENVLSRVFTEFGGGMARARNGNIYWTGVYAKPGGALRFVSIRGSAKRWATIEDTKPVDKGYELA